MSNNLSRDLSLGQNGEDIVLEFLREKYPDAKRIFGNHKEYDILIPSQDLRIEVKTDLLSQDTGNLAIEYESYGKPSGINVTTAEFWAFIYFYKDTWYGGLWPIKSLKEVCKKAWSVSGGDDMASKIYLFPVSKAHKLMDTWKIPEKMLETLARTR